ncbi:hypothetical protein D3C73_1235280 [compost metagenome]
MGSSLKQPSLLPESGDDVSGSLLFSGVFRKTRLLSTSDKLFKTELPTPVKEQHIQKPQIFQAHPCNMMLNKFSTPDLLQDRLN